LPVVPGDTVSYSLGAAGAGGVNNANGAAGGNTTVTVAPIYALDNIRSKNGIPVGGIDTASGKLNRAGSFSSGKYLTIPNGIMNISGDFSFEVWVNPTNTLGTNPRCFSLVSGGLNLQAGYRNSTMLPFVRINNVTYSITTALSTGTWQHVVYKSSGGTITIYVNGTEYSTTAGGVPSANSTNSAIGFGNGGTGPNGLLDEAVLYNRALTSTEVTGRYNSGTGTESLSGSGWDVTSAAVSQWHLNEASWVSSTITANGGAGGTYNNNATAAGGSFSGGDGGATGGVGGGATGDKGGAGGGAIGTVAGGTSSGSAGVIGAQSADVSGLQAVLSEVGGYPITTQGSGSAAGSPATANINNGGTATGFGCGGGGAGYYGGNGGGGLYGGGGGGAAGYTATNMTGGAGGQGIIILSWSSVIDYIPYTPPYLR
jgi:hypothetical protein